jgi:tRNA nucleotidyltransferase/poly(A) polymerase
MSDYLFLMESRVSPEQWQALAAMQNAAIAQELNLYLAGGAVRDLIAGLPIDDLDFVVEGKALKLLPVLTRHGARVLWQNAALQAAELQFASGALGSVSQALSETYSKPGSRPVAAPGTIVQDLKRRDFAMNAIALSLNPNSRGLLLDPANGLADIEKKEIRTLHNRAFLDDPTRMFRAVRLRVRLGFSWDPKTAQQFQSAREQGVADQAAGESLAHELRQLARERNAAEVLKALEKEKLLRALSPRLQGPALNWQLLARARKASQMLRHAGLRAPSFSLFLRLLCGKLPVKDQVQLLQRIALKKAEWNLSQKEEAEAKRLAKEMQGKAGNIPTKLFQMLSKASPDVLLILLVSYPQPKVQVRLKAYLTKYLPLRRHLPERELQQLGVKAGTVRYQKILDAYFFAAIEGELRTPGQQQKFLARLAQETK